MQISTMFPIKKPKTFMILGSLAIGTTYAAWSTIRDKKTIHIEHAPAVTQQARAVVPDLPEAIPYLLVGGGSSSHAAMRAIRAQDADARIIIVTDENYGPYMRPALSKELWLADRELRQGFSFPGFGDKNRNILFEHDEFYLPLQSMMTREHGGVSLIKNLNLTKLDPIAKEAYFENGQTIKFDKCLLATGGKPRSLPELEKLPQDRVVYFRTAEDFLRLEEISSKANSITILGGGLLGSELACSLATQDQVPKNQQIYQFFPEFGNLGKLLPQHLSENLTAKVMGDGVKVIPNVELKFAHWNDKSNIIELNLSNGTKISTDYVVAAVGMHPNVNLAKASGLEVDERLGGFLVNAELEARSNIWVSGDASCFYDTKLGRRRFEHHDHAVNSGRLAGQNMMGANKPYVHQPMFWSDIGTQVSFEAVGIIDSSLPTVTVFAEEDGEDNVEAEEGRKQLQQPEKVELSDSNSKEENSKQPKGEAAVIFYLKDDIVVGILFWNLFGRLTLARRIISEQKKYDNFDELAKLFNIHLDN